MTDRNQCVACRHTCHDTEMTCKFCRCVICACFECEKQRYGGIPRATPPVIKDSWVLEVTDQGLMAALDGPTIPVIVLYHRNDKGVCVVMAREFDMLAENYRGVFLFLRCDLDENPSIDDLMALEGPPVTVVYSAKESDELARWDGNFTFEFMAQKLKSLFLRRPKK